MLLRVIISSGYNVKGRNDLERQITHFLFPDNTLVLCKDDEEKMSYLSLILV